MTSIETTIDDTIKLHGKVNDALQDMTRGEPYLSNKECATIIDKIIAKNKEMEYELNLLAEDVSINPHDYN